MTTVWNTNVDESNNAEDHKETCADHCKVIINNIPRTKILQTLEFIAYGLIIFGLVTAIIVIIYKM